MLIFLVSNFVSPLFDGLDGLFDNGSLGDLSDWGKNVSSGLWKSKTVRDCGRDGMRDCLRGQRVDGGVANSWNNSSSCGSKNTGKNDLKAIDRWIDLILEFERNLTNLLSKNNLCNANSYLTADIFKHFYFTPSFCSYTKFATNNIFSRGGGQNAIYVEKQRALKVR